MTIPARRQNLQRRQVFGNAYLFRAFRMLAAALLLWPPFASAQAQEPVPAVEAPAVAPKTLPEERQEEGLQEEAAGKVFNAKSYSLKNGMTVVVVENSRAPVVTHMVWYRVGAADEPPGRSGIAHFLEHLLFKGSQQIGGPDLAPGEFSRIVRGLGGNDNAFTSQDYTAYFQSVPAEHLETVMRMEAGRMRGAAFPPEEVMAERQVIMEERRQRTDNDPQARFEEQLQAALFIHNPYGIPVIGWMHEIAQLSWDDAYGFYSQHYAPNNAILVVSGDVKGEQVYELAQEIYGGIEAGYIPARNRTASPPLGGRVLVRFSDPAVRQPMFERIYRVPSYRQSESDSLALQVLEEIAGTGQSSRLYKSLVIEQKLASSASLSYSSSAWDDARLFVSAAPKDGVPLEQLEAAIDAELQKLIDAPVTEDELNDALTRMQAAAIYARDSLTGPAMTIGYSLITGADLDDVEYWPRNISKVTAEQVQDVAKRYLDPAAETTRFVSGYLEVGHE